MILPSTSQQAMSNHQKDPEGKLEKMLGGADNIW